MFRFRFSHFMVCLAAVICGVSVGRWLYVVYGAQSITLEYSGDFFSMFLNEIYSVILPLLILGTLSVTVYCVPAATVFLFFRALADGYYVFSSVERMSRVGVSLMGIFAPAVRVFYTYGFFLLALRCMCYREMAKGQSAAVSTLFRPDGLRFMGDYASVAGVITLCGLYSFSLIYFL